jgi:hypothetical protein
MAERVHVSHSALSMVLLCGGLGAVLSYPISSRMMSSLGARKTMLFSGLALLAVLVAIGGAPTVPLLMVAVLGLGVTASTFDVAVNSAATKREKETGKSELSKLHGLGWPVRWPWPSTMAMRRWMRMMPAKSSRKNRSRCRAVRCCSWAHSASSARWPKAASPTGAVCS